MRSFLLFFALVTLGMFYACQKETLPLSDLTSQDNLSASLTDRGGHHGDSLGHCDSLNHHHVDSLHIHHHLDSLHLDSLIHHHPHDSLPQDTTGHGPHGGPHGGPKGGGHGHGGGKGGK